MIVRHRTAPRFDLPGVQFVGLASPSRGAAETSLWRVSIAPGTPGTPHAVDREELFHGLAGRAAVELDGEPLELGAGDVLIVPAGTPFALSNPHAEPFEAVVVLPVGGRAVLPGGTTLLPPWTE